MRLHMRAALLSVILSVMASGVCFAIHKAKPAETEVALPGSSAAALSLYITSTDPYKKWALWPGKGKFYKGSEPHGSLLTTYVNDVALSGIKKKRGMKDGAIIVKENYTADRQFTALTVMYKIKGYNPGAGDWYWVKYGADGMVQNAGRVKGCINCHSAAENNDYLFSGKVIK
jgi:hypothetical protein